MGQNPAGESGQDCLPPVRDWGLTAGCRARGIPSMGNAPNGSRGCPGWLRGLLEREPEVVEQLALEADAVGAHPGGEGQPEVRARQPAGHQARLEQRLPEASLGEPRPPLLDRLDVIEAAARALDQAEVWFGRANDLLLSEGEPRARELAPHESQVPRVRVARRVDRGLAGIAGVGAEDHRLEIEPSAGRQHARHPLEDPSIDVLLAAGPVILGRAEVLERSEARHRVERPEAVACDLADVIEARVESVAPAGVRLCLRERHPEPLAATLADVVEERPPAAAQIQDPTARADPDLLRDVRVLARLGLLERHREVAVVLGPAEVRHLAQAQPEDPVDQRVGELEVRALGHRPRDGRGGRENTGLRLAGYYRHAEVSRHRGRDERRPALSLP